MQKRATSLVALGASAGGVEPLKTVAADLPQDLAAAVAVVLHVSPHGRSRLPLILDRASALPATHAVDGEPLLAGRIYVAPPDHHLIVRNGRCVVVRGPRENRARPAIDPLFRSAAAQFGQRAIAVVLSGARSDGVAGAAAIWAGGGTVVVQDPDEAEFPDMPANAIALDHPDCVLTLGAIAPTVAELVEKLSQEADVSENVRDEMNLETSYATLDRDTIRRPGPSGPRSAYSCPACGGVLWQVEDDGDLLRFRCRVGHAYTAESALDDRSEEIDRALWASLRALHEQAALSERIARRQRDRDGSEKTAKRFEQLADEARDQAELIRTVLLERNGTGG